MTCSRTCRMDVAYCATEMIDCEQNAIRGAPASQARQEQRTPLKSMFSGEYETDSPGGFPHRTNSLRKTVVRKPRNGSRNADGGGHRIVLVANRSSNTAHLCKKFAVIQRIALFTVDGACFRKSVNRRDRVRRVNFERFGT